MKKLNKETEKLPLTPAFLRGLKDYIGPKVWKFYMGKKKNKRTQKKKAEKPEEMVEVIGRMKFLLLPGINSSIMCYIFFVISPFKTEPSWYIVKKSIFYQYKPGDTIPLSLL